jgi:hypothetical protein
LRLLAAIALAGALTTPLARAETPVSLEFGYLNTNHDEYQSGFVWGATVKGDQRLTFGVGIRFYENTVKWETVIDNGGEPVTFWYEEHFRTFALSPYAYFDLFKGDPVNQIVIGVGPQIHFVTAEKVYVRERFSEQVRESRLGFGALIRYERRIEMFDKLFFAAEAYYSYMEGTFLKIDNYQPPLEPVNMLGFVAGLGYPL